MPNRPDASKGLESFRTLDLGEPRAHLHRVSWSATFPEAILCAEESAVKTHPPYTSAKEGDPRGGAGYA